MKLTRDQIWEQVWNQIETKVDNQVAGSMWDTLKEFKIWVELEDIYWDIHSQINDEIYWVIHK